LIEDVLKPNFRQGKFFNGVNQVVEKISGAILNDESLPKTSPVKNFLGKLVGEAISTVISFFLSLVLLTIIVPYI
jgi:uncharacterized membrane protein YgcG